MTPDELSDVTDIWCEMFKDDELVVVKVAIKNLLNQLEYPPTIADVKKELGKLVSVATDEDTAIDEWNAIRTAIKSSIYYSVENFAKLPEIAKKFVGSPTQLRDWAMTEDFNDAVIRGQFLKQYEVLKERKNYEKMLKSNTKLAEIIDMSKFKVIGDTNDNQNTAIMQVKKE